MPEVPADLVKLFRAIAATMDTPIIVLTTQDDPEKKSQAFAWARTIFDKTAG